MKNLLMSSAKVCFLVLFGASPFVKFTFALETKLFQPDRVQHYEIVGALPVGLSLNAQTGVISGTPTTAGNYIFTVVLTDSANQMVEKTLQIIINQTADAVAPGKPMSVQIEM